MITTFADTLKIHLNASLFELRMAISKIIKIPYHNLNFGTSHSFPISEITLAAHHVSNNKKESLIGTNDANQSKLIIQQAMDENRDGKTFDFDAETRILLKEIGLNKFDHVVFEDLRKVT